MAIARAAIEALQTQDPSLQVLDLYALNFDPRLTRQERERFYDPAAALTRDSPFAEELRGARRLVLIFPQWWFNVPAIMKGFFDRALAPGVAFEHAKDGGAIRPLLTQLAEVVAITTAGSPAWVDWLAMGRPVRRVLRRAIVGGCAPNARFRMLCHYHVERSTQAQRQAFLSRVRRWIVR